MWRTGNICILRVVPGLLALLLVACQSEQATETRGSLPLLPDAASLPEYSALQHVIHKEISGKTDSYKAFPLLQKIAAKPRQALRIIGPYLEEETFYPAYARLRQWRLPVSKFTCPLLESRSARQWLQRFAACLDVFQVWLNHELQAEGWNRQSLQGLLDESLSMMTGNTGDDEDLLEQRWRQLDKDLDQAHLLAVTIAIGKMLSHDNLEHLQALSQQAASSLPIKAKSLVGDLVLASFADDQHKENAAVIFEPGGNDHYDSAACARGNISIVVDFAGMDEYHDEGECGTASAVAGVAYLLDMAGDDLYQGSRMTQAAAFFGHALLQDMQGNDEFHAAEFSQSAAVFGTARLENRQGQDQYRALLYSQAFAGPYSSALLLDKQGDDIYRVGGAYPSVYGTAGVFRAHGQGMSSGWRKKMPGGLAMLRDLGGDDQYFGGNFSQGVGYYMGLGILQDLAGNDRYTATRYSQGAAAHHAAGVLLDDAGNDVYKAKVAANQGAAWDVAMALLLDRAGHDSYHGGDLAIGAAAQNSLALFLDEDGDDSYKLSGKGLGYAGDNTYHDGRNALSIGFFNDESGTDIYPAGRDNESRKISGKGGYFIDD